jgi:hypothetical protein
VEVLKKTSNQSGDFMKVLLSIALLLTVGLGISAQERPKVFIAETDDEMSSFLTASLLKKKAPIQLTLDQESADYLILAGNTKGDAGVLDVLVNIKRDTKQGSVRVISLKDKSIVFATSAGDKTFFASNLRKGGMGKVADRLADSLIKDFFKKL